MVGQGVVLKALSEGHKVIGLDIGPSSLIPTSDLASYSPSESDAGGEKGKGGYKYHQLDATDYSAYHKIIKDEGCNAIIHLAATFNKFGDDGELLTHVPSHVRLVLLPLPPLPPPCQPRYCLLYQFHSKPLVLAYTS
jgi:hypothetical protein